ncbi:MAG: NeuD/PglB/VioB family sugar acetyltransferase [Phycisphaerales bacterium]
MNNAPIPEIRGDFSPAFEPLPTVVITGGGHARVVIDAAHLSNEILVTAIVDDNEALVGHTVDGVPVLGTTADLPSLAEHGLRQFVIGLGGTDRNGGADERRRLFEAGRSAGLEPIAVIHPRSIVSPRAAVGAGAVLLAGSILNAGATVGTNAIVNSGAVIEHDVVIGDHAHIAPGAVLCGGVTIGDFCHVGAGAVIRQGVSVADGAVVGAGAVVIADVAPSQLVLGVPGRSRALSA